MVKPQGIAITVCTSLVLFVACDPSRPTEAQPSTPPRAPAPRPVTPGAATPANPPTASAVPARATWTPPPTSPATVKLERDAVLRSIRNGLPPGWRMLAEADRLVIERIQPVWVLAENRMNAPMSTETEAERAARIQRNGKRTRSRIVYRAASGWSPDAIQRVREHNARIHRLLGQLPDRHGVRHLVDAVRHRKLSDPRSVATPEELPRVEAYETEQKHLLAQVRPLPTFLTEHYALFTAENEGCSDGFHIVHPQKAAEECYRLSDTVRELLAKHGTKVR